ncbi:MAG TPA: bifunctional diaminohydroxyphosphoribosylaminopyrimidine deaminase/5-amino-6-(5-phosphoribosylamino)uracil reductase RibD [Candidatus Desulfofervidus auxilii]|uniref:Riboflavin biosynthesis protein RibD n=1 Tax=Desulfofervidus auxilii TaxID=1621989 RepID=A0A7V0NEI4_DESA2|nr:bifunctional diaminohydroxyphosphoribosylaminopyrimidine deaminase/5-amino-6-(5-phosphoribosylamino)uracil reductase RibD [Candidatus Desulfofervidus auxilii]
MKRDKVFYMQYAIALAKKARGRTSPNPLVGAVIVKDGRIVGKGYHKKAGLPHAEIEAIKAAGEQAKGADLYVTLEPCNHYGRTPPCTEAILRAGIKRVFVGMRDPNPHVKGKGIEYLKSKGIEVEIGILEKKCQRLNEMFIKYVTTGMPFVSLKLAATLDGKIALNNSETKWITNKKSRLFTHHLRDIHDAILVGINTVLKDDPALTTRLPKKKGRDPVRIILDTHLRIPLNAKVLHLNSDAKTVIVTAFDVLTEKVKVLETMGVEVWQIGLENGQLSLRELLALLGKKGIMSVLVEGGAKVATSFLKQKLVDKIYFFYAPKIVGREHLSMVGELGISSLKKAIQFKDVSLRRFENDILIVGYPDERDSFI